MPIKPGIRILLALGALLFARPETPFCRAGEPFPYDLDAGRETGLILTAGVFYGTGWWLDRASDAPAPGGTDAPDTRSLNFLDRPATRLWSPAAGRASDRLVTGQLIAPLGLNFTGGAPGQRAEITMMYLETTALNTGLTYLLKNAFRRTRPFVYNRHPDISPELKASRTARRSFPSGHTANAFASMVFLATVFEKTNPGSAAADRVWVACLSSATLTGALRVAGGRHFLSDVLAGAALGSLTGWLVPRCHEIDPPGPTAKNASPSVQLSWRFGF